MKDETIAVEFTADVRDFLEKRGYTYIHSLGIQPEEVNDAEEPETEKENYWLEPLKPGDERLKGEPEPAIDKINSSSVLDMAAGQDMIQFMIKVPLIDHNDYLAKR